MNVKTIAPAATARPTAMPTATATATATAKCPAARCWSAAAGSRASRPRWTSRRPGSPSTSSKRARRSAARWPGWTRPSPRATAPRASFRPSWCSACATTTLKCSRWPTSNRWRARPGPFKVEIRRRPRSVIAEKCTGCGDCWSACPVRNTAEIPPPFEPSEPLAEAEAARINAILDRYAGDPGGMMPILQEINQAYGYLPRPVLEHMAWRRQMRLAGILRVASFYDRFSMARRPPRGRGVRGNVVPLPRVAGLARAVGEGNGHRARQDRPVGAFHAPHGALPRSVRLVAGHEDRRPELRPRQA